MLKKLILKYFKKQLLALYITQIQSKPIDFSELELAFVDSNGLRYYRVTRSVSLPIERLGMMKKYIGYMSAGISEHELNSLLDAADAALMNGLKTGKNAAAIGSILHQIRQRQNLVIHTQLLYNFLAVQWIREDEKFETFDEEIQKQKIKQFEIEVKNSNAWFFFQQAELKGVLNLLNMSETEFQKYFQESKDQQLILTESLKIYSSINV